MMIGCVYLWVMRQGFTKYPEKLPVYRYDFKKVIGSNRIFIKFVIESYE